MSEAPDEEFDPEARPKWNLYEIPAHSGRRFNGIADREPSPRLGLSIWTRFVDRFPLNPAFDFHRWLAVFSVPDIRSF